jgi:general secretion pathway protein C
METLIRKYLWAIDLLAIALSAVFVARATGVFVQSVMSRNTPAFTSSRRTTNDATVPATYYGKQVEDILKRNVFCSTCPPILPEPEKAGGPAPDPEPTKTTLPLRLMAIMFSPPPNDPRWSMAVIRDTEQNSAGPYAIGMKIREATVQDIQETRIFLNNAGKPEYLDLIEKPHSEAAAGPAPPAAPSTDPFVAEMEKGIKKLSEHSYEVQRGTVDSLLGNMAVLSRAARIVPEVRDGKAAGFRLFSVRPDGPFGKIGLQNGDVIYAINGLEMTSPDKALEIYTKLKSANHLAVALERNGQKITKDYNIR